MQIISAINVSCVASSNLNFLPGCCDRVFSEAMPYKYIGRTTDFKGKTLWEILGNLKNYGVGRIIARSRFERYPEPSFIKILKVETLPDPEIKSIDNLRKVRVWAERTFRGRKYPEPALVEPASYKTDYKLIPKDEEKAYCEWTPPQENARVLPRTIPVPPLLRELIVREMRARGEALVEEPEMEMVYRQTIDNPYRVAKEGEAPNVEVTSNLGTPAAPRLYQGIKL